MLATLFHPLNALDYSYGYHSPTNSHLSAGALAAILVVVALVAILVITSMWKTFQKAGRPGWAAIIPIYNNWVQLEIGGQPGWWALVAFIPVVGLISIIFVILAYIEISKRFGKSPWFAALLVLLPFIGWPILGFGNAQYTLPGEEQTFGGPEPPYPPVEQPPASPIQ